MSATRLGALLGLCATAAVVSACAPALRRQQLGGSPIENIDIRKVPVRGFLVEVEYFTSSDKRDTEDVEGELLAIDQSHIWVLDKKKRTWAIARHRIDDIDIELFSNDAKIGASLWTAGGAVSAISHGWFFALSLPVWLGVGIPTAVASSGTKGVPKSKLDLLYQYARFPAGIPPSWRAHRIIGARPESLGRAAPPGASCLQRCELDRRRCDAACTQAGPCRASCWDAITGCQIACRKKMKATPPRPTSRPTSQPTSLPAPAKTDGPGDKDHGPDEPGHRSR